MRQSFKALNHKKVRKGIILGHQEAIIEQKKQFKWPYGSYLNLNMSYIYIIPLNWPKSTSE